MANVFISHAGADLGRAAELRGWLIAAGHRVFLDRDLRDGIAVGEDVVQKLNERLRWADATVCVVTSAYLESTWCAAEVGIAQFAGARLLPVRAEKEVVHPLLQRYLYTDMVDDPDSARTWLTAALQQIDGGGGLGWADDRSPFPGLRHFDADQHRAFFGRSEETEELARLIRSPVGRAHNSMLLVVGPSGCGKSSLVRAGLLPKMADEPGWWSLSVFTPGIDPQAALSREFAASAREAELEQTPAEIRQHIDRGTLVEFIDELLLAPQGDRRTRLLVVIDQLEELATQTPDADRASFAALLRDVLGGPVDVVATLRPEFLDRMLSDPDLSSLPMRTHVVRPLGREALRTVIKGPASLAGLKISDELVAKIVDDTGTGEALPLLAFTLNQLASGVPRGGELTAERYSSLGGVQGALIRQADSALAEAIAATGRQRDQVIEGLLRLVTVDEENRPTRWHVRRDDLPGPVSTELDIFIEHRLLTTDTLNDDLIIAASHEMFFTTWPPLSEAIESAASRLRARRSLESAAAGWDDDGRQASALWERRQVTTALRAYDARAHHKVIAERIDVGEAGRNFLLASIRRNRIRRGLVLGPLTLLVVVALALGLIQWRDGRQQTLVASARQAMTTAEALLDSDPRTALKLNLAAHHLDPTPETSASLRRAVTTTPYAGELIGPDSPVSSIAYSSDGTYLAAGFDSGEVVLWDLSDPLRPQQVGEPFSAFDSSVTLAFSPNGRHLITIASEGTLAIWDLDDPTSPRQLSGHERSKNYPRDASWLSPDGTLLATGEVGLVFDPSMDDSPGQPVQLWDLANPANPRRLGPPIPVSGVDAIAFSRTRNLVAVAADPYDDNESGTVVRLWDMHIQQSGRWRRTASFDSGSFGDLSFSPDGTLLAVATWGGTSLWNLNDVENPRPIGDPIHEGMFSEAKFSTRRSMLATTDAAQRRVSLWDLSNPNSPELHERLVIRDDYRTFSVSPNGRTLATGGESGRITLQSTDRLGRPRLSGIPFGASNGGRNYSSLAISGDIMLLATGNEDGTVSLWDISDQAHPRRLKRLRGGADAVAFSPEGATLATGGSSGVSLWDVSDPDSPRRLTKITNTAGSVHSIVFLADSKTLVVGAEQGATYWNIEEPETPVGLAYVLAEEEVLNLWRVGEERIMAFIGGSVPKLWEITDPSKPQLLRSDLRDRRGWPVNIAEVSPEGEFLVASHLGGYARFWDLKITQGGHLSDQDVSPGKRRWSHALAFSPATDVLVAGGLDGVAHLWDLSNPAVPRQLDAILAENSSEIIHSVFSSDGSTLVMAGGAGDIALWDMNAMNELHKHADATACRLTGGGLGQDQWELYLPVVDYRETCPR